MIKVEARLVKEADWEYYEIRRIYSIFGYVIFKTEFFKVSDFWPGLTLYLSDIKRLDIRIIN